MDVNARATLFGAARLGGLTLRNRVIKTATYEGMTPHGAPSPALVEHHRALAAGGVGMTTVAYCAVSPSGCTFAEQMYMREAIVPGLRDVTTAVHAAGAAASLQLGHCGFFSKNRAAGRWPLGPSLAFNAYGAMAGMPIARAMREADIDTVVEDFGQAAALAVRAGFDAVELHLGHGYLLSQFLSPAINRRRDHWGGSLDNRMRLPLAVLARVRSAVGAQVPIIAKTNLRDGFRGGLELDDAVGVAQRLEAAGIDAIELSGGFTSRTPFYLFRGARPLAEMIAAEKSRLQKLTLRWFGPRVIREYPFEEMFFLPQARAVRAAVRVPLILLGGLLSLDNLETAMREGFDFVAMGRALIADPDLIARMQRGDATRSRCISCNKCVPSSDTGGVRCVLDD
ncbi:MAG: NADH:flavin oxidoreductase [bacterium]